MTGRLFLIVGPSGAGKDTVIAGAMARLAPEDDVILARRFITRPLHPGGAEQHVPVTPAAFARMRAAGAFALDWDSHGLRYGLGIELRAWLAAGMTVIANGSRAALPQARAVFGAALIATEITARPETLAARLAARGRESAGDIAARLSRTDALPHAPVDLRIPNDDAPDVASGLLLAAIRQGAMICA
ncbi:ribose 1,5-bisphosphokinase [Roseovarius sp. MBR-78]|jgi:ribose 1,5-bisphosphokinase|uniref:phosphonate metabolism protein/1,5-bisphosphokinase (PRPP-forming) PhnN n=1 Tax=Roseovarius sp. MBR-78 TaxID=3156460 RepID=UPI003398D8B8